MPHPLLKLASTVTFDAWPSLPCPECGEGALSATGKLVTLMDPISEAFLRRVNAGFEAPDRLTGTCSGQLICNNPKCRRAVLISGDWIYDQDYDEDTGKDPWHDYVRVRYISPPLPIITPPPATPENVSAAILAASELLWINPNAAANQLRQAVEELLTHKRIPRSTLNKNRKRHRLTTHARIDLFRATQPEVADALEAVKWIGNSGSHESALSIADVLEGAGYLAHALTELYDHTAKLRRARINQINSRKGIPRTPKP